MVFFNITIYFRIENPMFLEFVTFINLELFLRRMGRIKTKQIKATTFNLLDNYEDRFATDFKANKTAINDLTVYHSKKMRNAIAGYLTRLKKAKRR
jgi:small subunit ribosomal protein S17e